MAATPQGMTLVTAIANGATITSAMIAMSQLYKSHWRTRHAHPLPATYSIAGVTAVVTALQFLWPAVIPALQRDTAALSAGQWWRLITPLLIQPYGVLQAAFNGLFIAILLPISERLYGRGLWILYLASGIVGQAVNYEWQRGGGGSSTAVFGLMGGLLVFLIRNRRSIPAAFLLLPAIGICGAITMAALRDGHGPVLLAGAITALMLPIREANAPARAPLRAASKN